MYLYIYLANLFYYFILYQYMCITLNVYIDLYIVQHHRILLYKYGAIEINRHLHEVNRFWNVKSEHNSDLHFIHLCFLEWQ